MQDKVLILDGAMGTELHKRGYLHDVNAPEELNIRFPGRIEEIHDDYLRAGSDIVIANTFGANRHKLASYGREDQVVELNAAGIQVARAAAQKYNALVGGDIGPLGAYLTPLGSITFNEAYDIFAQQVQALTSAGVDIIFIETMAEIREVKAALMAARDHSKVPVVVQMTFTSDGTTVTGTDVLSFLAVAEALGADAVGMNCSMGPEELFSLARLLAENTALPISFKPNAGMPQLVNRQTVFPGTVKEFVTASELAYQSGVSLLGGCCGTTPAFIKALAARLKGKKPAGNRESIERAWLSSRNKALDVAHTSDFIMIGERINPTNRKKFQEELGAGNFTTVRREASAQVSAGAQVIDLNLGLPGADEKALMVKAVEEVQEVVAVPLCLDSSSPDVLEAGIRQCAGKPIINSVNGDEHRLDKILPMAKRYGAMVIALTTDEKGLPSTEQERLVIAERIMNKAYAYGLSQSEIIFDFLTLSVSAMPGQTEATLAAIRASKQRWPRAKTVLGVSNVSFGLPNRQALNSTFLKMAREAGLDMGILNPAEDWSIDDGASRELLMGNDPQAQRYIATHGAVVRKAPVSIEKLSIDKQVSAAIIEGSREEIAGLVSTLVAAGWEPLSISNKLVLPALNEVGKKFSTKEFFLPQVMRSAETAQAAFGVLRPLLKKQSDWVAGKIVLATVKGDVHDIGKNIVGAVLESHGWDVIDLGKNIDASQIIVRARQENADIVGLSALMTTTMPEMEAVVLARTEAGLDVKILIGGAPVTDVYAREIGADGYAPDAVTAATIAGRLIGK